MKRTHGSNHSMLDTHSFLIAVLCVGYLKVIKYFLFDCHSISALLRPYLLGSNVQVDFGTKRSKVFVESFLATKWMAWIENVERLTIDLIATSDHLRNCCKLWLLFLSLSDLSCRIGLSSSGLHLIANMLANGVLAGSERTNA